jgi:hypothetical protein
MVVSYLLNFQITLENLLLKRLVVTAVCIQIVDRFVESSRQMESKIILFVMIGDRDFSKDNGTYYS